jgi:hypothetical protein
MDRRIAGRVTVLLLTSIIAFFYFSRTAGSESVRPLQVLLLFAAGLCVGVALTLYRVSRSL